MTRSAPKRPSPQDGETAAARATEARNEARRAHPCPDCEGIGWVGPDDGMRRCGTCQGEGTLLARRVS